MVTEVHPAIGIHVEEVRKKLVEEEKANRQTGLAGRSQIINGVKFKDREKLVERAA